MKNLETNRKLMANRKKYSTLRTLYLKLVSSVAEDANKNRQVHLTSEVAGPACQNIEGNYHIRGQKKIAFSYSDPEGTLEKIKAPKTLIYPQQRALSLDQRANPADQKRNPQKINMRVMTSQCETKGKNHIC